MPTVGPVAIFVNFLKDKIEELAFSRVEENDSLWESGVLDSITIVELAVEIESQYNISIPFEEITVNHFETISLIKKFIEKKQ